MNLEINKIYLGDCIKLIKDIPDKSIDLIVTDPPYEFISKNPIGGGFYSGNNRLHLKKIKDSFGMSFKPKDYLEEFKRIMKTMNLYIFTNKTLLTTYINFAEENKFKWDLLIWEKNNPIPANCGHYLIDKEYCVYIKQSGATFNSKLNYKKYFTCFHYPIGAKATKHPTEKPVEFIKNMIEISSNENNLILDPFLGSGTTAIACINTKRNYIGIEKDEEYFKIAIARIKSSNSQLQFKI